MIRAATPSDAEAIANLHIIAWRQAYTGLLPQSFLGSLDSETGTDNWRRILADPNNSAAVRLDETASGELAGFASFGASRDDDATPESAELLAMYYRQPYWGSGRAGELWARVREALEQAGYSRCCLWVLFENSRAIAFYHKQGFVFDGHERNATIRGTPLREIRMVLSIA